MKKIIVLILLAFALLIALTPPNIDSYGVHASKNEAQPAHSVMPTGPLSYSFTVTAVVPPHREVVMDGQMRIIQIVSNTVQDTEPVYVKGKVGGERLVNCDVCRVQYERLETHLDFNEIGVVYRAQ